MRTALAHGLGLGLVAVLLTGCQGEEAGDLPTTPRALAWLAADHLGDPSRAIAERDAAEEFGSGGVGTEMGYGQQLVLAVGEGLDPSSYDCDSKDVEGLAGCEETDGGVLIWEDLAPEGTRGSSMSSYRRVTVPS